MSRKSQCDSSSTTTTVTMLYGALGMITNLPFLSLLLTSVSCAVVVLWTWLLAYREFFRHTKTVKVKKKKLD